MAKSGLVQWVGMMEYLIGGLKLMHVTSVEVRYGTGADSASHVITNRIGLRECLGNNVGTPMHH